MISFRCQPSHGRQEAKPNVPIALKMPQPAMKGYATSRMRLRQRHTTTELTVRTSIHRKRTETTMERRTTLDGSTDEFREYCDFFLFYFAMRWYFNVCDILSYTILLCTTFPCSFTTRFRISIISKLQLFWHEIRIFLRIHAFFKVTRC